MKRVMYLPHRNRQGSTLVIVLIFIVMFSALAVAMASMSGANAQVAENYHKADGVRGCAESGFDVMHFWLNKISFTGTTAPENRFNVLAIALQDNLADANVTNIVPVQIGSTIRTSNTPLHTRTSQSFSAVLTKITDDNIRVDVTGHYGPASRTVRSNYIFGKKPHNVFDYGLASVGSMHLSGGLDIIPSDPNLEVEANVYIESQEYVALVVEGKSNVSGKVTLKHDKNVELRGAQAKINGLTHTEGALQNVTVDPNKIVEFPPMFPQQFYGWANNPMTSATTTTDGTWDNIVVPPNLNPTISGRALRGVIYVQTPNVVTFAGGTTITGIIVTNGDPNYFPDPNFPTPENPTTPHLTFEANTNSYPVEEQLPHLPKFDRLTPDGPALWEMTGTFVLAPGFWVEFAGSFGMISGAIGANGIRMSGGAGGILDGTLINYAPTKMWLKGTGELVINRSGMTLLPAGFAPDVVLHYDSSSYSEVSL